MTFEQAITIMDEFRAGIPDRFPRLAPEPYEIYDPAEPFAAWASDWRSEFPDSASGLYFFLWPDNEIVYVGKATEQNLAGRVWGHLNTPIHHPDGRFELPRCRFLGREGLDASLEDALRAGRFRVAAVGVEPAVLSSLLETLVQTIHERREGRLPDLNLQIG